MLLVAATLLILVGVALAGGDLRRLAYVQLKAPWLLFLALGLQILVILIIPDNDTLPLAMIHNATYVLAAIFIVLNRRIRGLLVLALGAALNGVTIAANGGTLPARPGALRTAGLDNERGNFVNSGILEDPRLGFLGDIFAIPAGWPLANVFSIGDVIVCAGVALIVYSICVQDGAWPHNPRDEDSSPLAGPPAGG